MFHAIKRRSWVMFAALAMAITVLATSGLSAASSAHAISQHGAGGYWSPYGGWVGNFYNSATNTWVYCVDHWTEASGSGGAGAIRGEIPSARGGLIGGTREVTGDELRKVNYAISVHGQTSDDITAAAVAAYVWSFTSTEEYGNGMAYVAGPHVSNIRARYNQIKADTEANYDRLEPAGGVDLRFIVDPGNHYLGTLEVGELSPMNSVGTITLHNGVFADTGLALRDGVVGNSSFDIIAIPPANGGSFKIRAEAAFQGQGEPGYQANVRLHTDTEQRTAGPGVRFSGETAFEFASDDPSPRTASFQPVVSTTVASRLVREGEEFADLLTFSTVADAQGVNNFWYRNAEGEYATVIARATIYGPFEDQPAESEWPPPGAPTAAENIVFETSPRQGPTVNYTVESGFVPKKAGYYTWVWAIDEAEQPPQTRTFLPDGYRFTDRFGQIAETSIAPSRLSISTQVTAAEVGIGQLVSDEVTVAPQNGAWVQVNGQRVPVTLTGTAYFSEAAPRLASSPPPEVQVLQEMSIVTDGAQTEVSEALRAPLEAGYVVFQWCLLEARQPLEYRGLIEETCDDYGQPSETAKVVMPTVRTEAKAEAVLGDTIHDTAIVNGPVPESATLVFEVFKKPEVGDLKRDEAGAVAAERWSAEEIEAIGAEAICVAENRVTVSESVRVNPGHNAEQRYESPSVEVEEIGTYWWIENLLHEDLETGEVTVLHAGECGLPNETSRVMSPPEPQEPLPPTGADGALLGGVLPPAMLTAGIGALVIALSLAIGRLQARGRGGSPRVLV